MVKLVYVNKVKTIEWILSNENELIMCLKLILPPHFVLRAQYFSSTDRFIMVVNDGDMNFIICSYNNNLNSTPSLNSDLTAKEIFFKRVINSTLYLFDYINKNYQERLGSLSVKLVANDKLIKFDNRPYLFKCFKRPGKNVILLPEDIENLIKEDKLIIY